MTMLPNIEEAMEDARNGKLSPYWQNNLKRECLHGELSAEERLALSELNCILSETPQWSSEEELCHDMENIGGRVRFCRFWNEHYSMVQLTEDRNGKYSTAYVLDTKTTPDVRKAAALQAQKKTCGLYAGVGCFASGYVCSRTDEVRFSCRSCFSPHASPQRPGAYHRVKKRPVGMRSLHWKMQIKGAWGIPQQAFCNAK